LWRNVSYESEFAGRQRSTINQGCEHSGSNRIAKQTADLRNSRTHLHGIILAAQA